MRNDLETSAFESAAIGMALVAPDGRWLQVNQSLCEIVGYSRDELLRTSFQAITHPDDLETDLAFVQEALRGDRQTYSMEKRYIHKTGHVVWILLTATIVRRADGSPDYFISQVQNIAQRRQAEDSLASAWMTLDTVVRASPAAIIAVDVSGNTTLWNPSAERLLGWTSAEVIGRPPPHIPAEHEDAFRALLSGAAHGDVVLPRVERLRKDGSRILVSAAIAALRGPDGQMIGNMAILTDLTEQERLEAALRQAQKLDAVGQLAAGIAHDFNNILTAVKSYSDLLMTDASDAQRDDLMEINAAADRGAALTRQLLTFSRHQMVHAVELDLRDVVMDMERLLRRLLIGGTALHVDPPPSIRVIADRGQLEQVLVNLVVNARDAMPSGGTIRLSIADAPIEHELRADLGAVPPGHYASLQISDSGTGIALDLLPRIAEPFFTTKESGQGTGLGLSTVFGIVAQHHGHLTINTRIGRGTDVTVYLPSAGVVVTPTSIAAVSAAEAEQGVVLLVDDDSAVRTPLARLLRKHDYEVIEARDGAEAKAMLARYGERVWVLITDVAMPGMSGLELAGQVQAQHPRTRLILMSGYSDSAADQGHLQSNAYAFLSKPFPPDALVRLVRRLMAERRPLTA